MRVSEYGKMWRKNYLHRDIDKIIFEKHVGYFLAHNTAQNCKHEVNTHGGSESSINKVPLTRSNRAGKNNGMRPEPKLHKRYDQN
jgi:hypothetical protein